MPTDKKLTPEEFRKYITDRGYQYRSIYNTTEQEQTGARARFMGYEMIGPGRTRGCAPLKDGTLSLFTVSLWCDGCDYARQRLESRRLLAMRV